MQQAIQTTAQKLAEAGVEYIVNEPLKKHSTFKIGGPAALFVQPQTAAQLALALRIAKQSGLPYMPLGRGSNILFHDEGYHGIVLQTNALNTVKVEGNTLVAETGASLAEACLTAKEYALAGLEFAYGIPGSVGGAVYMNAGAYGGEMSDVLESVTFIDAEGDMRTKPACDLGLGYRTSLFQQQPWYIVSAVVSLRHGEQQAIAAKMKDYRQRRIDKQPLEFPSAGSAFKRPPGQFAGALIDECGLRGYRVGDAAISEKHCGFIVNLGNASCREVLQLADEVAEKVYKSTGTRLEKEIRTIPPGGLE